MIKTTSKKREHTTRGAIHQQQYITPKRGLFKKGSKKQEPPLETPKTKKEKPSKKLINTITRKSRQRYLKCIYRHSIHDINNCTDLHCITCAKTYIANLSGRDLTDPQILLLSKGLSFIPIAKDSTHFELFRDFDKFCNKIWLLSLHRHHITIGKRFPLKRIQKYKPRRSFFSLPNLEGILESIKVELSQIPTTEN